MSVSNRIEPQSERGLFDAPRIVADFGVLDARRQASSPLQRICVDAAQAVLGAPRDASRRIVGTIAMTYLPYRDPGPAIARWAARCGAVRYVLVPGASGYPYGAKARILLLHLIDHAVRSNSPSIEIDPSMRAWLRDLGIAPGGRSYRLVAEQGRRLAECRFEWPGTHATPQTALLSFQRFIRGFEIDLEAGSRRFVAVEAMGDRPELLSRALLDSGFVQYARENPVVLDRVAIGQLGDNGWALDLYVWLARQLPLLRTPLAIDWKTFLDGFDDRMARNRAKARTLDTLPLVASVYPQARFAVGRFGIVLYPSDPPCDWANAPLAKCAASDASQPEQ